MPTFVAIDFETADYARDSACAQIIIKAIKQGSILGPY